MTDLINRLRTESLDSAKCSMSIMDLCMEAAVALEKYAKAQEEGRVLPYGPGDSVWDRFGMEWMVDSAEIHMLDDIRTPLYRCGHPGTNDYCALWADEALTKEAGVKAGEAWAEELAALAGEGKE